MESDTNVDGVTERYVVTLEQRGAERSRSRRHQNDETPGRADSRRRAVDRSRSQRRLERFTAIFRRPAATTGDKVGMNHHPLTSDDGTA